MLPSVLDGRRPLILIRLLANGLAQGALAIIMALLIDRVLGGAVNPAARQELQVNHPAALPLLLLLGALAMVGLRAWQRRDAEALGLDYVHAVRIRLFRHACGLPLNSQGPRLGPMMARMTNDLLAVKNWISYGIASLAVAGTLLSATIAFIAWSHPALALAALIGLLAAVLTAAMAIGPLSHRVRLARRHRGRLAANLGDKLTTREAIMALGRTDREARKLNKQSQQLTDALISRALLSGCLRAASELVLPISVCTLAFAISIASWSGIGGNQALPSPTVWVFVMATSVAQLVEAFRAWDYWINFGPARARLNSLFRHPTLDSQGPMVTAPNEPLCLRGSVNTSCPPGLPETGLPESSIVIERGKLVAVAGGTANEKSRILTVMARLDTAADITATLDDVPLVSLHVADVRRFIVLTSPEISLFRGTIGGNLRKAAPKRSSQDIFAAALLACRLIAEEGEAAAALKQDIAGHTGTLPLLLAARVRVARALVTRRPFVLIDEPMLVADTTLRQNLEVWARAYGVGIAFVTGPAALGSTTIAHAA